MYSIARIDDGDRTSVVSEASRSLHSVSITTPVPGAVRYLSHDTPPRDTVALFVIHNINNRLYISDIVSSSTRHIVQVQPVYR